MGHRGEATWWLGRPETQVPWIANSDIDSCHYYSSSWWIKSCAYQLPYRIQILADHFSSAEDLKKIRCLKSTYLRWLISLPKKKEEEGWRRKKNHYLFFHMRYHIGVPTTNSRNHNEINCIHIQTSLSFFLSLSYFLTHTHKADEGNETMKTHYQ